MDWREARQIYLPSLNMSVGQAWNRLKKLWKSYKIAGRNGESRSFQAYEIVRHQVALDLPRSDLPELEGMSDYEFEDQDQSSGSEPRPDDWSMEDEQLRREEFSLVHTKTFPDHHVYKQSEIRNIEKEAIQNGAEVLLTTAKDAVKLKHLKFNFPCFVVKNGLAFEDESAFTQLIQNPKSKI